ncbi:MAG: PAS domain S-box protein, partial [Burkholderiales bacterium]|nr:PAS domain S-box protein [Burkholderiales bacterium]
AALASLATFAVRLHLPVDVGNRPVLILFMLPILASAMLGGFLPGVAATAAAAWLTSDFVLTPVGSFDIDNTTDFLTWMLLLISGLLASGLSGAMHRSRQRETARLQELTAQHARLQRSESRFEATFEQAAVGIALVAPDGRWLRVNRRLCEIVGYSPDELLATTFQQITHPDDLSSDLNQVGRMLAGEIQTYALEKRYLRKDGAVVWINLTVGLVRRADGAPDYFVSVVEDISARKQAESALQASQAAALEAQRQALLQSQRERDEQRQRAEALSLLKAIAESSVDAIFAKDLQGRYVFCNHAAAALTGLNRNQIIGRNLTDVFSAEVAGRLAANDAVVMVDGKAQIFEEVIEGPLGTRSVICARGPLFDADGALMGVYGVSRDVTEARRAERALRDSEAHYRTVVSALSEGILVIDVQGKVLSYNAAATRILGLPQQAFADSATNMPPGWVPLRADGSEMPQDEWPSRRVLAGGGPQRGVLTALRDATQTVHWIESNAEPVIDADTGRVMAVVTSFTDVTQRREQEAELARHRDELEALVVERTDQLEVLNRSLEQQHRFLRNIADAIPAQIGYVDAQRNCRFINAAYATGFGVDIEAAIGQPMCDIMGETLFRRSEPQIESALRGQRQEFQRELTDADGTTRYSRITYVPDVEGTTVHGFVVVSSDITELKQAELKLSAQNVELAVRAGQAEAATRTKSAFLANMSHEIRTPMNAIIGLTHLLARDTRDALQRERLTKVDDAARHLLQVINDILDLSKIEAGKLTLEDTEFALDPLLTRVFEMVGTAARAKGLELVLD